MAWLNQMIEDQDILSVTHRGEEVSKLVSFTVSTFEDIDFSLLVRPLGWPRGILGVIIMVGLDF